MEWQPALRDAMRTSLCRDGDAGGDQAAMFSERIRQDAVARQQRPPRRNTKLILCTSLEAAFRGWTDRKRRRRGDAGVQPYALLPHSEVPAVLRRLRGRYRLTIISKTDDDLITRTSSGTGFVATAGQAWTYKANYRLSEHARTSMDLAREDMIHLTTGRLTDLKAYHE